MNIKVIGFSILFMFSAGAHASVVVTQSIAKSITRTQTAINTTKGVTANSAFSRIQASSAALAARLAGKSDVVNRLESISQAIENVAAEDSEVDGMSKALRVEALANIFTVVALTDLKESEKAESKKVVNFVMGKPYTAVSSPNAQGKEALNGDAIANFNRILVSALSSNPESISADHMSQATQAVVNVSLAEMGPCSNASLAGNR